MEVVVVVRLERRHHCDDRVPGGGCVGAPANEKVAAEVGRQPIAQVANRGHLLSVGRRIWRDRPAVEDAHVLREPGDHEIRVHSSQLLCCQADAGFHEHLEPQPETIRIELLVTAGVC